MNLRQQAEANLAFTLEDDVSGFGWPITYTEPAADGGGVHAVKGQYHRIGVDTNELGGLMMGQDKSVVTMRISSLGVDPKKGGRIDTMDITGTAVAGLVTNEGLSFDRAAGRVTIVFKRAE